MSSLRNILVAVMAAAAIVMSASANAQEVKHYRFAYDQPIGVTGVSLEQQKVVTQRIGEMACDALAPVSSSAKADDPVLRNAYILRCRPGLLDARIRGHDVRVKLRAQWPLTSPRRA